MSFQKDLFKNKNILITGGATGIGLGIGLGFAEHGANVTIMGRRQQVLDEAIAKYKSKGFTALAVQGDVRSEDSCRGVFAAAEEKFGGPVDILVNNAAGNFMCSAEELSTNGFRTVIDIDLQGTFNMCKASLPYLQRSAKENRGGVIINITATLHYTAMPFQIHASSAKAGIDVITQTLAAEWGSYGIRVVGIAPGPISGTEGGPGGRVFGVGDGQFLDSQAKVLVPLQRYGTTDDIANTALFLASPAASFITATTIVVDGGQWHNSGPLFHSLKDIVSKKKEAEKNRKPKL